MPWAPDYASDEELRNYVEIGDLDDEAQLSLARSGASRAIDYATNRQFGKVDAPEERFYTPWPDYQRGYWCLDIDDLMTAAGVVVDVDGTTIATYLLEPRNAAPKSRPWTRLVFTADSEAQPSSCAVVSVTAAWGWTEVPDTVVQATLLQALRFFTRRNAPFGVVGSPEMGSELRLLAKVDPDVAVMLNGYHRPRRSG